MFGHSQPAVSPPYEAICREKLSKALPVVSLRLEYCTGLCSHEAISPSHPQDVDQGPLQEIFNSKPTGLSIHVVISAPHPQDVDQGPSPPGHHQPAAAAQVVCHVCGHAEPCQGLTTALSHPHKVGGGDWLVGSVQVNKHRVGHVFVSVSI